MNLARCIIVILITISCTEPIIFDNENPAIEVDAKVSTLKNESYVIIYYPLNEELGAIDYEVSVVSSFGEVIPFQKDEVPGKYTPVAPDFVGEVNSAYRLQVQSSVGYEIISEYDTIMPAVDFDIVIEDTVKAILTANNTIAYQTAYAAIAEIAPSTIKYNSRFVFRYTYYDWFTNELLVTFADELVLFKCGEDASCNQLIRQVVWIQEDKIWTFLNPIQECETITSDSCTLPCCVLFESYETNFEIVQQTISDKTYEFWSNVNLLLDNDGLMFDTYPFPVSGNVSCKGCDSDLIGQFSAVSESKKSLVIPL